MLIDPKKFDSELDLKIEKGLLEVPAYKLTPPVIRYSFENKRVQRASWNLLGSIRPQDVPEDQEPGLKFMSAAKIDRLVMVMFDGTFPSPADVNRFDRLLQKTLKSHGMSVTTPTHFVDRTMVKPGDLQALEESFDPSTWTAPPGKNTFLFVLPDSSLVAYGNVKKVFDCKYGFKNKFLRISLKHCFEDQFQTGWRRALFRRR